jgi:HKD family nuclease
MVQQRKQNRQENFIPFLAGETTEHGCLVAQKQIRQIVHNIAYQFRRKSYNSRITNSHKNTAHCLTMNIETVYTYDLETTDGPTEAVMP